MTDAEDFQNLQEQLNQRMLAQLTEAMLEGDEEVLRLIRNITFTGMGLGVHLSLTQLQNDKIGSMEGVIANLEQHRDNWQALAERFKRR